MSGNPTLNRPRLRQGRQAIDFGRPLLAVRLPGITRRGRSFTAVPDGLSARVDLRGVVVVVVLILAAVAAAFAELATGDLHIPITEVVRAVFGADTENAEIVTQWRAPRVVLALVLGILLGISGAIFQTLTRNPLGSPDIIGFNTGAYTGALVVLLVLDGVATSYYPTAIGALIGGIVTALLVYLLAFKRGVQGFRLIIVGIATSAVLAAVNTWLILKADLEDAMSAAVWGGGNTQQQRVGARAAGADRRGDPGDSRLLGRLPDANARHGRRRGGRPRYPGRTDAVGDDRRRSQSDGDRHSGRRTHLVRRTGGAAVGPTAHSLGGGDGHRVGRDGSAGTGGQ